MADILELTFFMWIIAVVSFAPLGYFIYLFTLGDGESFGKSNPKDHSVENTKYYNVINSVMETLLGGGGSPLASKRTPTPTKKPAVQKEADSNPVIQSEPNVESNAFNAATWNSAGSSAKKKKKKKSK